MINREVYNLIALNAGKKIVKLKDSGYIENVLFQLAEKIDEKIRNEEIRYALDFQSDYDLFSNIGMIDFKVSENENFYISIDETHLSYGFSCRVYKNVVNHNFNKEVNPIIKRYFPSLIIQNFKEEFNELSGEYKLSIRQLNSRDFFNYCTFIMDKFVRVSKAIINSNLILKEAV